VTTDAERRDDNKPQGDRDPTRVVGRRIVQSLLDRALLVLLTMVVAVLTAIPAIGLYARSSPHGSRWVLVLPVAVAALATLAAELVNELWLVRRWGGATLGMRIMGLRVVTRDGGVPGLKAQLLRWLMWVADGMFFGLVGIVLMCCTRYHQRLGDLVAETYVVRADAVPRARDTAGASGHEVRLPGPDGDLGAVADA
jgi:uncharacterized RDD family membrane protein YckC